MVRIANLARSKRENPGWGEGLPEKMIKKFLLKSESKLTVSDNCGTDMIDTMRSIHVHLGGGGTKHNVFLQTS